MNVLAKIVIPKTNVTMGYINSELEEFAREEFFRLKKILEIKRKMYGDKKEKNAPKRDEKPKKQKPRPTAKKASEELKQESKVEIAKEESKVKFNIECAFCGLPINRESMDVKDTVKQNPKLDDFIEQITDILNLTKNIDEQGLVSASVDDFIRAAEELKVKLEKTGPSITSILSDIDINNLCEACKERYKTKQAMKLLEEIKPILHEESSKETIKSVSSTKSTNTVKSKQMEPNTSNYQNTELDLELGTFETEFKEITKIVRVKKEDGSVSEEKKVIKIKREIRTPVSIRSLQIPKSITSSNTQGGTSNQPSASSSKSNPYSGSKAVGIVSIRNSDNKSATWSQDEVQRKVRSEIFSPFSPMSDPVERFCMSSFTLLSTDLDFEFGDSRDESFISGVPASSSLKSQITQAEKKLKMNVLKKIVIPRTNVTVGYILTELEEMAREEFHRLKKVKEKKKSDREKREKRTASLRNKENKVFDGICPACEEDNKDKFQEPVIVTPKVIMSKPKSETKLLEIAQPIAELIVKPVDIEIKTEYEPVTENLEKESTAPSKNVSTVVFIADETSVETKLEYLKRHLNTLITLGKEFVLSGVEAIDLDEFLTICEEAKLKMGQMFVEENYPKQVEEKFESRLEHLKIHLREVISIAKDFKSDSYLSPSVDNFIQTCEEIEVKLNVNKKVIEMYGAKPVVDGKEQFEELTENINNVLKIIEEYKSQGLLLSPSVEEFIKSCSSVKLKLKDNPVKQKYDHLKEHVINLDKLTIDMKQEGIASKSIDDFKKTCKQFQDKIEELKIQDTPKNSNTILSDLVDQIDETINLGKEAKAGGLISESLEDFIKSIELIKISIEANSKDNKTSKDEQPCVLSNIQSNIDEIMNMISKVKTDSLAFDSIGDFLKSCKKAKDKIDYCKKTPPELKSQKTSPTCSGTCTCENQVPDNFVSHRYPFSDGEVPCTECKEVVEEEPSNDSICDVCSHPLEEEYIAQEDPYISPEQSKSIETYCDLCKRRMEAGEICPEQPEIEIENIPVTTPDPADSTLGYFEKKFRKKTKLTRTLNPDGTIREERETVTIRKEKHDPKETSLLDDSDDDDEYVSDSIIDEDEEQNVALCIIPNYSHRRFLENTRSLIDPKSSPLSGPVLRQCISLDTLISCSFQDYLSVTSSMANSVCSSNSAKIS